MNNCCTRIEDLKKVMLNDHLLIVKFCDAKKKL